MTFHHIATHKFKSSMAAVSLAAAALLGTTFDASAELRRGEKSFGPRIGYCGANSSVMAGLTFQYSLSRVVRLAPEADVVFRNNDKIGRAHV